MNKRYVAAGIMLVSAFTLWFLVTVRADNVGKYQLSDLAMIVAGVVLGVGAIPVSGDFSKKDSESEDNEDD